MITSEADRLSGEPSREDERKDPKSFVRVRLPPKESAIRNYQKIETISNSNLTFDRAFRRPCLSMQLPAKPPDCQRLQ